MFQRLILIIVVVFFTKSAVFGVSADTTLLFEFPQLPKSNYYIGTGKCPTTKCSVYIPTNFTNKREIPAILWIDGGTGGAGDHVEYMKKIFGTSDFILINFPLFKNNIEPLLPDSSNYWTRFRIRNQDSDVLWNSYSVMIDSVFSALPQIDILNSFMGGFSNGAHATAVLLNRNQHEITRYFNKFLFIEGGDGLSDYSVLKDRSILYMQGTKLTYPNWVKSYYMNAKRYKAKAEFVYMKGVGHFFSEKYYKTLTIWMCESVKPMNVISKCK